MPVIALTQEMGSLAKDVAEQLARDLELSLTRHEIGAQVANRMQVSKSLINRLREGKAGRLERLRADKRSIAVFSAEEVLGSAAQGDVVLRGWGATCLLRPVSHVLCVRVTRPLPQRIEWLMAHLETDDAELAEAEIRRSDRAHATRMHEQFGVTWGDPLLYDIVLNTERVSLDSCVQQIRALTQRPEFAPTEQSTALLQDMAVQARVHAALKAQARTREINITVESVQGRIALRGIVVADAERRDAEQIAAGVAGVTGVDNQLRTMATSRLFPSSKT